MHSPACLGLYVDAEDLQFKGLDQRIYTLQSVGH